jgi:hypothetical protein
MLFDQIIVGTTEDVLLIPNPSRTSVIIFNTHATATIYIYSTKNRGSNGFPIKAGGAMSFKVPEDDVVGRMFIISDTADTDVRFYEGFGYLDERWFKPA